MGKRIVVMVKRSLFVHFSNVRVATRASDMVKKHARNLYTTAPKGGLAVSFLYRGTSMCFVSAHLAAHKGVTYTEERNAQAADLLSKDALPFANENKLGVDFEHRYDYVFLGGDLNYRLRGETLGETLETSRSTSENHYKAANVEVQRALREGREDSWRRLYDADELQLLIKEGKVMSNFCDCRPATPAANPPLGLCGAKLLNANGWSWVTVSRWQGR